MTLNPAVDNCNNCLKKTSALPLAGGKHMSGHFICLGPVSYIVHSFLSSSSTTSCEIMFLKNHNLSVNKII